MFAALGPRSPEHVGPYGRNPDFRTAFIGRFKMGVAVDLVEPEDHRFATSSGSTFRAASAQAITLPNTGFLNGTAGARFAFARPTHERIDRAAVDENDGNRTAVIRSGRRVDLGASAAYVNQLNFVQPVRRLPA